MVKRTVIIALLLPFAIAVSASAQEKKTIKINGVEYKAATADGLELYGWLTESPDDHAPLYVLLPMMGNTHTSYKPFVSALLKRWMATDTTAESFVMPHILSLDLRGHGQSIMKNGVEISHQTMAIEEFSKYPDDVLKMIDRVLADKSRKIDRVGMVVIGASIGANTAIMLTERIPEISKVVMLSPGENYRSLAPTEALKKFAGKSLIMAGADDEYSKESSEVMAKLNPNCTLKIFPGPDHGTDITDNHPEAMIYLIDWLIKK